MNIKTVTRIMKALSDPGRVRIIKMLEMRELCVCEIQAALGLAQPTVSKHLKILEDAGLVESRRERAWMIYRLVEDGADPAVSGLLSHLRGLLEDDQQVKVMREKLATISREKICRM